MKDRLMPLHCRRLLAAGSVALLMLAGLAPAARAQTAPVAAPPKAAAAPAPATASLDDRIQDAKADVIRLNRDLMVLEEELLFPANTQVAIFVSMDVGKLFSLDSVRIKLDDKDVAAYLYTPAEVQAHLCRQPEVGRARDRCLLHRQGPARPRLQARHDDQVRQGHRPQVHRTADQGLHRQASAGVRGQGLAVSGGRWR
jgi:hypothetical protein